jgi:hypothetical protein
MILNNKLAQMDDLLDRMAEEIQLDKTRYQRMLEHYEAVKNWIESDEKFFKPFKYDVYPHGSVRILTTVKPFGREEFDLDIAIHLMANWRIHTPQKIYNELKRRLAEHSTYKGMMELKNRCIRLNYAGDFHMDILPGVQENELDINKLMVPDRKLGIWVSSNPRGYANWFLGKANMVKESLLEKALRAEKLPVDDFNNKKPLQRAVQLIKRYRDIYFQKDDRYRTSSIVLTTIAGLYYQGEESIFDTVEAIIMRLQQETALSSKRIKVLNPVNPQEDFTDKWEEEPQYYVEFRKFCNHLYVQWQSLKEKHDVVSESVILKGLFGNELFTKAQQSQAMAVELQRRKNELAVDKKTGIITSVGATSIPIKQNTFFGK